ncbi:MAG: hypothetical protein K1X53_06200 [Candidatus Sumerlaeaceae bacterium]|nr:hypothetical protein [Candidatus Sumerlaeaceae bacterium]
MQEFRIQGVNKPKGTKRMSQYRDTPQPITFVDVAWRAMHTSGWNLKHYAYTESGSGGVRHLVHASKSSSDLVATAPTLGEAVKILCEKAFEAA